MKKIIIGFFLVLVMGLLGCAASHPPLSRAEWVTLTTRHYDGVSVDQALNAAEKLFRLADGDDFQISYDDDSLYAYRKWSVYLVLAATMGTDSWLVRARPDGDGVIVTIHVSSQSGSILPVPTAQGDTAVTSTPTMAGPPIEGTALYNLFWARLDYLLGKANRWTDCSEFYKWEDEKNVWGNGEPLCNHFNIADKTPTPSDNHL